MSLVQMQEDAAVRWRLKSKKMLERNDSFSLHLAAQRKQLDGKLGRAHFVIGEAWVTLTGPSLAAVNGRNHANELC